MSDFLFAGEHSTAYHVRLLKSPISVLPGTRDKVITLPGRHGSLRMLPDLGERSLQLDLWLAADSLEQLYSRLDTVRAWLNPLRGQQQIIFDRTPDRYYLATVAGVLDAEIVSKQGQFEAEFVCPDPFAYAITPQVITITASPHTHNQLGTMSAEPLYRVRGVSAGGGQEIRLAVGTQSITYRGALATGEWLEIDSRDKTVIRVAVGGARASVMSQIVKPVFPMLAAGNNTITVIPSGGATWSLLEIHCRNRWL